MVWQAAAEETHHGTHGLLWGGKLNEGHACGAAVCVHDEADAAGLDLVAAEELAHICCAGLEGDALDLEDALTTKAQCQGGLHLLAGHLDQAHVSVPKLLIEHLVVLLTHGPGGLLVALKVNKGLHVHRSTHRVTVSKG